MKNLNKIFRVAPLALFSVLVVAGCSSSPDPGNTCLLYTSRCV